MLIEERGNTNVLSLKFADKIGYLSAACDLRVRSIAAREARKLQAGNLAFELVKKSSRRITEIARRVKSSNW